MKECDNSYLEQRVGEVVDGYLAKRLRENQEAILDIDPNLPIDEAIEQCKDANWYVRFTANNYTELYEGYKYRIIKSDNGYLIVQGEELDTDPEGGV